MRLLSSHCSTRQDGLSLRLSRRKWAEIHANESSAIERKTGVVSAADRVLRAQPFIRSESMPSTLTSECGVRTAEPVHYTPCVSSKRCQDRQVATEVRPAARRPVGSSVRRVGSSPQVGKCQLAPASSLNSGLASKEALQRHAVHTDDSL